MNYILKQYDNDLPLDLELSNEGLKNGFKKGQFLEIEPMLLIFYHD